MKTQKQVLAMFQAMQRKMFGKTDGLLVIDTYQKGGYWTITAKRVTFQGKEIDERDIVEWGHHTIYNEAKEEANEAAVAKFKEKFGL